MPHPVRGGRQASSRKLKASMQQDSKDCNLRPTTKQTHLYLRDTINLQNVEDELDHIIQIH